MAELASSRAWRVDISPSSKQEPGRAGPRTLRHEISARPAPPPPPSTCARSRRERRHLLRPSVEMQTRRGTLYHVPPFRHGAAGKHNNFVSSRFFRSPAGILKIFVFVCFVAVVGVFFGIPNKCNRQGEWLLFLFPIVALLTALGTVLTYTIFMLGWAEEDPDRLVKVDLSATSLLILLNIGVAIATFLAECTLPGVLMLVGAVLAAISGGALFILWRYATEEVEERQEEVTQLPQDTRDRGLSIHI